MDNVVVKERLSRKHKMEKEKIVELTEGSLALVIALDKAIKCGNNNKESIYNDRGIILLKKIKQVKRHKFV